MKRLSNSQRAIVKYECQIFEDLAIRLFASWRVFRKAKLSLKQNSRLTVDPMTKENYEKYKKEMEEFHLNRCKDVCGEKEHYPEIQGFSFPDNLILASALRDLFGSKREINIEDSGKISWTSTVLVSLKSYFVSKLYKNFDAVCSAEEIKPDDFFHDLWVAANSIKEDSHYLRGYWSWTFWRILKANLSAKSWSTKAEQRKKIVEDLLFGEYQGKASGKFYDDPKLKETGYAINTIIKVVKELKKKRKEGKTDG